MPSNGDWDQSQRLVMESLRAHGKTLSHLRDDINTCKISLAVLQDRAQQYEIAGEQAAKSIAVRWGTGFGALISTIIGGLWAFFNKGTP